MKRLLKHAFLIMPLALLGSLSLVACARTDASSASSTETSTEIYAGKMDYPLFRDTFLEIQEQVDQLLVAGIDVPLPRDAGGGYTHEQHKRNYNTIFNAGSLFEITGESKYAEHARKLLIAYAEMYPTLGEHPQKKEQTPGRLFWQSLNEAVFLVHSIQGYEKILPALSAKDRQYIEENLFQRQASFLSEGQPQTFNKIHNHGTWATAAVGITGYVLGDDDLVEKALMGLDKSGNYGFLKQLDELFSPDGYYSEGPYYQRYALLPFVVFAQSIQKNEPERKIFEYRDGILGKAIDTTIHLSYDGKFFPINDALREKGLRTPELQFGLAAKFSLSGNPEYLSISELQGKVVLSPEGLAIARAVHEGKAEPFPFRTMQLTDGRDGDNGALAILRSGYDSLHQAVIVKNTSQGMGHGHFDKLALLVYDNGQEILADYGAARFLNVVEKNGGHYLRENNTWAKQTIAHNTLVVDETSHFGGKLKEAEKFHPEIVFFAKRDGISITKSRMENAYADTAFERTVAQVDYEPVGAPIVIDLLRVKSENQHQYDLPVHYKGQITKVSFPYRAATGQLTPLGEANGYQHLWHVAHGSPEEQFNQITWLKENRFYTYSFLMPENSEVAFTRLGANDPDFNLRPETSFIVRQKDKQDSVFVSVLEPHGDYNPSDEYTIGSQSNIKSVAYFESGGSEFISIETKDGHWLGVALSGDVDEKNTHSVIVDGNELNWVGPYKLFHSQNNKDKGK